MIVLINPDDRRAVRNKETLLGFYELAINNKKPEEAAAMYVAPGYIQHNPLIPDGSEALGRYFAQITTDFPRARVVVHRIIAVGDYVWAHVNFLNINNNDLEDPGIAGVDIWKMDDEGNALEHWDTLQPAGTPDDAAPWVAPGLPRANQNGMF